LADLLILGLRRARARGYFVAYRAIAGFSAYP
jgi:hypothetical protein